MTMPREQGRLSVPLLLFPHLCQACSLCLVVAISFTSCNVHTHGGRHYTNTVGAALPALQGTMAWDCVNGYDRPCWGKVQRGEPACPKSQGKSTAWPDLGYQSPPPNARITTGLYSQQEESVGRASVSWDSALPSLPKHIPSLLRPSPIPAPNPAVPQTPGWYHGTWVPPGRDSAGTAVPSGSRGRSPNHSQVGPLAATPGLTQSHIHISFPWSGLLTLA